MDFQYRAVNAQGHSVSGQISAASEREAVRLLRQKELTPLEVAPAGHKPAARLARTKRSSNQEKTLVIRERATLLQAGVSLAE